MARICRIVKLLVPLVSFIIAIATDSVSGQSIGTSYRGKYLGPLTSRKHSVSGHVYAVDSRTLHLQGFTYDGTGPDAFFWVGFTDSPGPQGIIVPNERGTKEVLTAYNNADVTISLPDGLTLRDIKWFAVWCRAYEVNFGDLYIPPNFDYPQPHVIGSIVGQGVSSGPIVVVDAQTILVPDFSYDGQAPDLHFWVGRGTPGPDGIRVPDETGGDAALARADKKTLVLSLPGDLTVFDIDYFGVWSRLYNIDYGHVRIQPGLNVPPSLRMLGISPQTRLNCEVLHDESALEIRWSVVGSGETIVFQLVGRIDEGNYMAFGLSGESDRSVMLGGDVAVGWMDKNTGRGHVVDYYLERKSVCIGTAGSCPDIHWKEGTNNVRMLSAASVNGFTILTYQRKLGGADIYDKNILTNGSQPVIWAVGPIKNGEAQYHSLRNKDDLSIDFGRVPKWNCPEPEAEPETSPNAPSPATILMQSTQSAVAAAHKNDIPSAAPTPRSASTTTTATTTGRPSSSSMTLVQGYQFASPVVDRTTPTTLSQEHKAPVTAPSPASWAVPPIPCYEPDDRVYYAQLGPTAGTYGYRSITGRQDKPQEAWYINGLLLPEIYLVRNLNYTFVIQGGDNANVPSDYNPLYITDDPEGGHETKSLIERQGVKVYAGLELDAQGRHVPTAMGKLCRWVENGKEPADTFTSYAAYQRSLFLNCDKGHSGVLHFTPTRETPDVLYYQSYTRRHLGWKIHVVDDCEVPAESRVHPLQLQQQQSQTNVKSNNVVALQQPQILSLPQAQQQLQHLHQRPEILHLSEPSRQSDQRHGENANHQSILSPLVSIDGSKTILNNSPPVASVSPVSGFGSGRPMENAYLFASASPTGIPNLAMASALIKSPHHQQQQIPSIIALDPNRLLINAKPGDGGIQVPHGVSQYPHLQGLHTAQGHAHAMMSMAGQPEAYQFSHGSPIFQVTMDGAGTSLGNQGVATSSLSGNRMQTQGSFPSASYSLSGLADGHLMRRAGPQPQLQSIPQPMSSGPMSQFKFSKVGDRSEIMYDSRPDYYVGTNRAPLVSHSIRYDGIPIVYASTMSPVARANNPVPYMAHGEKHGDFPEMPPGLGQNPLMRFQDARLRSPAEINGGSVDNIKYLEIPSSPHNIHLMHGGGGGGFIGGTGTGSRIAPPSAPASSWAQTRKLPKREQNQALFQQPSIPLNPQRRRGNPKTLDGAWDAQGNDNLYQNEKMDEHTNSPSQSFAQVQANNKGITTIPLPNLPTLLSLSRHDQPGNHEDVNSHSGSSTSLPAFETQRSGPKTQGPVASQEDMSSRGEKGSSNYNQGLLNTNSMPRCNGTEKNSSCSHDPSNLQLSQQLGSLQISPNAQKHSEENDNIPISTTSPQPATTGASAALDQTSPRQTAEAGSQIRRLKKRRFGARKISGESASTTTSQSSPSNRTEHNNNDDDNDSGDETTKKLSTLLPIMENNRNSSGGGSGGKTTPTLTSHTTPTYEKADGLRPVYESFSPVFRPSPLDIDGFNVSLNFGASLKQGSSSNRTPTSMREGAQLTSNTPDHPSASSSPGSQGHPLTPGKRKFRHPQLLPNIGYFSSQSQARDSPREKTLLTSASSLMQNGGMIGSNPPGPFPSFTFANERIPAGLTPTYFHDAMKLFNLHGPPRHPHFPYHLLKQQRLPPPHHHPMFSIPPRNQRPAPVMPSSVDGKIGGKFGGGGAGKLVSLGGTNGVDGLGLNRKPLSSSSQIGHVGIPSRNDLLAAHTSPVITIMSPPKKLVQPLIHNRETAIKVAQQGAHMDDLRQQLIDKRNWVQLSSLMSEEATSSEEIKPKDEKDTEAVMSSDENEEDAQTTQVLDNTSNEDVEENWTEDNSTALQMSGRREGMPEKDMNDNDKYEAEPAQKTGGTVKHDLKDGDGEEEGSAPDSLSLTLLTDIWQTINQDNGSKTPSQKPPAAVPGIKSASHLLSHRYSEHQHEQPRFNPHSHHHHPHQHAFPQQQQSNRQLPPRMLVSGGGRNRPGLFLQRQPLPPPGITPSLHFGQRAF